MGWTDRKAVGSEKDEPQILEVTLKYNLSALQISRTNLT